MVYNCNKCGAELNGDNWHPSLRKHRNYICKKCHFKCVALWRKANPDKVKIYDTKHHRKAGQHPMNENKQCASFLGVHVAEQVLVGVFKNVQRMPYGNPGYDFRCRYGYLVDVKSSCLYKDNRWGFNISYNTIADYFLCLAFDNRENLTPLHIWLLPGILVNKQNTAGICPNTVQKWIEYELDISKVSECCDVLKGAKSDGESL